MYYNYCKEQTRIKMKLKSKKEEYELFDKLSQDWWNEDGKFRGFFTLNSNVCRYALKVMGKTLDSKFDIQ